MKTKRLFVVAFVVSGLTFVPVQRSDAQTFVGLPGIGTGPGIDYGYPHFEYGYYPHGGYQYLQPSKYGGLGQTRKRFPATQHTSSQML